MQSFMLEGVPSEIQKEVATSEKFVNVTNFMEDFCDDSC